MAPRVDKGTLIILDIGRNVAELEEKQKTSFFESARECAMRFIEHKIISQSKNLLGIILLGSKKTENVLATQTPGSCRYIKMLAELQYGMANDSRFTRKRMCLFLHLCIIFKFEILLKQVINGNYEIFKPSQKTGNWFDALLVASEHFKYGVRDKILNKQIIIISNFKAPSDLEESDIKQALHGFQEEGFELSVLGPDIYDENNCNNDIELVRQFVDATNGAAATLEYTLGFHLLFHRKKVVNAIPWNVDLSIGPNIKIPISSYTRIRDEPVIKKWIKAVRDPVTQTISTYESIEKRKIFFNTESDTVVKINDSGTEDRVIKGYFYGGQVIPFSNCDKSMLYEAGPKSLIVYGFTKSSNITYQNLNGDGLSYVFGRRGDKNAEYAVRCLVECLLELDLVGIVRRVYNNGNAPKMFALMPVIDSNNFVCLSMAGICYKDEIKNMTFPLTNTKKYECNNEQVEAFKELIRAMELSKAYDDTLYEDTDAFPILKMCSPSAQYILDCIGFRAMNPDKPLPPPRQEIMKLLNVVPELEKRAKEPLEKLKKLFVLNKVEIKKRTKNVVEPMDIDDSNKSSTSTTNDVFKDEIPKIDLKMFKKPEVLKVGTVNPIEDYDNLKNSLNTMELHSQMAEAIECIFFCGIKEKISKALEAMLHFRTDCVKSDPSHYNNWLKKFNMAIKDRDLDHITNIINENKLSYILVSENSLSNIISESSKESQVYENDTVPNLTEVSISSEVNDLFDNM